MSLTTTARFEITVVQLRKLPPQSVPEIAFVGRSNAGKSTVINTLCNRRQLAHSSRTPGRTQALNYFALGYHKLLQAYFVDTPGYGYAAVAKDDKAKWDGLAGGYLTQRDALAGVVLVTDARRGLTDLDQQLLEWIGLSTPVLVLLNKADQLTHSQRLSTVRDITKSLGHTTRMADLQLFSGLKRMGIEATEQWILTQFQRSHLWKESEAVQTTESEAASGKEKTPTGVPGSNA